MGKSQETWNKKENEKKKEKKKKEKEARREERKANAKEGNSFEIAYVDEFGNFSSTPPDPTKKNEDQGRGHSDQCPTPYGDKRRSYQKRDRDLLQ